MANLDQRDSEGTTALMRAARTGDVVAIARLVGEGAGPDTVDLADHSALDYAIEANSEPAVRALLQARPMLGLQDHGGETALHQATQRGELTIVRDLLAAGADPTIVDAHGRTALAVARSSTMPQSAQITRALERAMHAHPSRGSP